MPYGTAVDSFRAFCCYVVVFPYTGRHNKPKDGGVSIRSWSPAGETAFFLMSGYPLGLSGAERLPLFLILYEENLYNSRGDLVLRDKRYVKYQIHVIFRAQIKTYAI